MSNVVALKRTGRQSPNIVKRKVSGRPKNTQVRSREYLEETEVSRLIDAAGKTGRHTHRDKTLLLVMYTHGLRVSELTSLVWSQVDLKNGRLHVKRAKGGMDSAHPLRGKEIRALRQLKKDYEALNTRYVFVTERGAPMTPSNVQKMIKRAGELAGFDEPMHPHMLRHSVGYKLANEGQDTRAIQHYLGHKNIMHTVRYTELAPNRFNNFWRD